jgi:hypothetical protein
MSNEDIYTTPKKVRINEFYNMSRIDSGNYPKENRRDNSYKAQDFKLFANDKTNERFDKVQYDIFKNYKKGPAPSGDKIVEDLKNLEQYRRWGGLSKKSRSFRNKHKRTKKSRRTKRTRSANK